MIYIPGHLEMTLYEKGQLKKSEIGQLEIAFVTFINKGQGEEWFTILEKKKSKDKEKGKVRLRFKYEFVDTNEESVKMEVSKKDEKSFSSFKVGKSKEDVSSTSSRKAIRHSMTVNAKELLERMEEEKSETSKKSRSVKHREPLRRKSTHDPTSLANRAKNTKVTFKKDKSVKSLTETSPKKKNQGQKT